MNTILSIATFGAGCFWCVEAVFEQLDGVHAVESGYMGGEVQDPTYREICSGTTGHAEVTQIHYDPKIISYETLLEIVRARTLAPSIARQSFTTMRLKEKPPKPPKSQHKKTLLPQSSQKSLPLAPTTPQKITIKITTGSIQTRLIAR